MPRIRYIGDAEDVAIPGGPLWAVGQERDLSDEEAAPYLRSNVFTTVGPGTAPATTLSPGANPESSPAIDQVADETPVQADEPPVEGQ